MDKVVVICTSYKPNTAPTNRYLSFFRGFDELAINVEVIYAYPNDSKDILDDSQYTTVSFKYLWEKHPVSNKVIKYIRSFWDVYHYIKKLPEKSIVIVLGASEYLPIVVSRKDFLVYEERSEHYDVVQLNPRFLQNLYLKSLPKLKGMFVISTALRKAFIEVGANNVNIINMTVDSSRFVGVIKQETYDYIAYCGTAYNNKDGVDELIKSFSIVHQKYPALKLYIIGKTPIKDDVSGNLQLIEKLGLKEAVVMTGVISAEKIPQVLKNAKILVLDRPDSLQARCGFPTKLGEYLLTENPVVVTRVGDIPLFLEDGISALISEERNAEAFSSKIIWAIEHPEESQRIGRNGAIVAQQSFNYLKETKKIVDIITKNIIVYNKQKQDV